MLETLWDPDWDDSTCGLFLQSIGWQPLRSSPSHFFLVFFVNSRKICFFSCISSQWIITGFVYYNAIDRNLLVLDIGHCLLMWCLRVALRLSHAWISKRRQRQKKNHLFLTFSWCFYILYCICEWPPSHLTTCSTVWTTVAGLVTFMDCTWLRDWDSVTRTVSFNAVNHSVNAIVNQ